MSHQDSHPFIRMVHPYYLSLVPSTDTSDLADTCNQHRITVPNLCRKVSDSCHKRLIIMTNRGCCPRCWDGTTRGSRYRRLTSDSQNKWRNRCVVCGVWSCGSRSTQQNMRRGEQMTKGHRKNNQLRIQQKLV